MAHMLETHQAITSNGTLIEVSSFGFTGDRKNIWHRLGQQFDGAGSDGGQLMTAEEAMRHAHMDRKVYAVKADAPEGMQWAADVAPYYVVLDGKMFLTDDGSFGNIPTKIVGVTGAQGAIAHGEMSVLDRFLLAEEAIHVSNGAAVWSTAGYIRDGRQGFATMQAPPIVVDPKGVADIYNSYLTIRWSYDGTVVGGGELGSSNIRVVCANTDAMHDATKRVCIKVKATSGAKARYELAAQHWAKAQDEAAALALQGERMLAVTNGRQVLNRLAEKVLGLAVTPDSSKRERTLRENKLDELHALYHGPTNAKAVGDNGYAAYQTVVEYLDWYSPVKGDDPDTARVANQFDGTYAKTKVAAADLVLSLA